MQYLSHSELVKSFKMLVQCCFIFGSQDARSVLLRYLDLEKADFEQLTLSMQHCTATKYREQDMSCKIPP